MSYFSSVTNRHYCQNNRNRYLTKKLKYLKKYKKGLSQAIERPRILEDEAPEPSSQLVMVVRNNPDTVTNSVVDLINRGADVNPTDQFGNTPLSLACRNNNTDLAQFLIERGVDVEISLIKAFIRPREFGVI
ncbi:MAG: ankyrin repeat domain-containing protein [Rickettsiaceae bacterium]|nr:ankyrin repeat domain-containing protein [Rickettsiaceae bacterium]